MPKDLQLGEKNIRPSLIRNIQFVIHSNVWYSRKTLCLCLSSFLASYSCISLHVLHIKAHLIVPGIKTNKKLKENTKGGSNTFYMTVYRPLLVLFHQAGSGVGFRPSCFFSLKKKCYCAIYFMLFDHLNIIFVWIYCSRDRYWHHTEHQHRHQRHPTFFFFFF